jgi:hypothetical protein
MLFDKVTWKTFDKEKHKILRTFAESNLLPINEKRLKISFAIKDIGALDVPMN